jgi:hypothetical protein
VNLTNGGRCTENQSTPVIPAEPRKEGTPVSSLTIVASKNTSASLRCSTNELFSLSG